MSVYDTGASGHFYCGQRVLTCSCCEGRVCGPGSGCNCAACKQLDLDAADARQQQADTSDSRGISSAEMIGSWTWGKQPGQCCCNGCSSTELLSRSQTIDKVGQLLGRGLVSKDNRQMKCTTSKLLTCRVTNGGLIWSAFMLFGSQKIKQHKSVGILVVCHFLTSQS